MKSQTSKFSITEQRSSAAGATQSINEACKCEVMQPGLYDIETEMCTPELDDAKAFIPPEIQNNILEKTPVINYLPPPKVMQISF